MKAFCNKLKHFLFKKKASSLQLSQNRSIGKRKGLLVPLQLHTQHFYQHSKHLHLLKQHLYTHQNRFQVPLPQQ